MLNKSKKISKKIFLFLFLFFYFFSNLYALKKTITDYTGTVEYGDKFYIVNIGTSQIVYVASGDAENSEPKTRIARNTAVPGEDKQFYLDTINYADSGNTPDFAKKYYFRENNKGLYLHADGNMTVKYTQAAKDGYDRSKIIFLSIPNSITTAITDYNSLKNNSDNNNVRLKYNTPLSMQAFVDNNYWTFINDSATNIIKQHGTSIPNDNSRFILVPTQETLDKKSDKDYNATTNPELIINLIGGFTDSAKYITPSNSWQYAKNLINNFSKVYTDRFYTVKVPDYLVGSDYVKTPANAVRDKKSTQVSFTANDSIEIYIALEKRIVTANKKPTWLDISWIAATEEVTLSNSGVFSLFKKSFTKGQNIILGPNVTDTTFADSNYGAQYLIFIKKTETTKQIQAPATTPTTISSNDTREVNLNDKFYIVNIVTGRYISNDGTTENSQAMTTDNIANARQFFLEKTGDSFDDYKTSEPKMTYPYYIRGVGATTSFDIFSYLHATGGDNNGYITYSKWNAENKPNFSQFKFIDSANAGNKTRLRYNTSLIIKANITNGYVFALAPDHHTAVDRNKVAYWQEDIANDNRFRFKLVPAPATASTTSPTTISNTEIINKLIALEKTYNNTEFNTILQNIITNVGSGTISIDLKFQLIKTINSNLNNDSMTTEVLNFIETNKDKFGLTQDQINNAKAAKNLKNNINSLTKEKLNTVYTDLKGFLPKI